MNPRTYILILAVGLSIGCQPSKKVHDHKDSHAHKDGHAHKDNHEHKHDDKHGKHDDHGHGDGHGDKHGHGDHGHGDHKHSSGPQEVVTKWGVNTQLYVEFDPLVTGKTSEWAVHMTQLRRHVPLESGTLVVELSGGGKPAEQFKSAAPQPAGVFHVNITPKHAVKRTIKVRVNSPMSIDQHELGAFPVVSDKSKAKVTQKHDHKEEPINFLLEQQWGVPFGVTKAKLEYVRDNVPAFGQLKLPPNAQAVIKAPEDGRFDIVGNRPAAVGEQVKKDTPLFSIRLGTQGASDPAALDLGVKQANITVRAAQREVDRVKPLVTQGAVAQKRLDAAQDKLLTAKAALQAAQRQAYRYRQTQRVKARGDRLNIPSPIDGVITALLVAPGARVEKGQILARVVNKRKLWLHADLPESYLGKLKKITGAWFRLDNYPTAFVLKGEDLVFMGQEVESNSRSLPVTFKVDNVRGELFVGMFTRVHMYVDAPKLTTTIHRDAIIDDGGTDVVFVQLDGEHFERRPVKMGVRDGDRVEILSGVKPGEWVVTTGGYSVKLAATPADSFGHGHAH